MQRLLVLAALCLGGCDVYINTCNVDQQVDSNLPMTGVMDCGRFYRGNANYTDDAMLSAQLCVLNALTSKQSFRLIYDADPTVGAVEPGLRAAWVGTYSATTISTIDQSVPEGDTIPALIPTLRSYAGRGGGDMASKDDLVSVQPCDTIDATPSCKPRVGTPCLTCTTKIIAAVGCRG